VEIDESGEMSTAQQEECRKTSNADAARAELAR
jgi:hypothetical protein